MGTATQSGAQAPHSRRFASSRASAAFSLLELMLALAIFSMVMTAVYSTWTAVLRGARVGNDVAAAAQRSRITARTFEDALLSTVMFQANARLYTFEADTSGDFAALSFVSRLPPSFPGGGYFGDLVVRRVIFSVVTAQDGTNDLVLQQVPILAAPDQSQEEQHTIVLARDVRRFGVEFLGQPGTPTASRTGEWATEWPFTNALPWVVRFTLAFGPPAAGDPNRTKDQTVRTVLLPSVMVPAASSQGSAPPAQPAGAAGLVQPPGAVPGEARPGSAPGVPPGGQPFAPVVPRP
jgi:prepilin-type N-terminal cleavage/methylation domain-containing protein